MIFDKQLVIIRYEVAKDVENKLDDVIVFTDFELEIYDLLNHFEFFYLVWLFFHELGNHIGKFETGK